MSVADAKSMVRVLVQACKHIVHGLKDTHITNCRFSLISFLISLNEQALITAILVSLSGLVDILVLVSFENLIEMLALFSILFCFQ